MRLIDADTLLAKFEHIEQTPSMGLRGIGLEPLMAIKDIKTLVQSRPTMDAIPVDWMVQRMNETSSGSGMNVELNNALFAVGVEWERWKKIMARWGLTNATD